MILQNRMINCALFLLGIHMFIAITQSGESQLSLATTSKPTSEVQPWNAPNKPDQHNGEIYFLTENKTVIRAQTGSKGLLPCIIYNVGECTVSWIRRKDYHLLTVGHSTYSSDERFQPTNFRNSQDWTLQIKYLQKRDAGTYECQVSSHPPKSIFIELDVVEARAYILGAVEKYIKPGSPLFLQCLILKTTEVPTYLFWYQNNDMINYEDALGFNVTTNFSLRVSSLFVPNTQVWHSGNYSCLPDNALSYSVIVHIFNELSKCYDGRFSDQYAQDETECSANSLLQNDRATLKEVVRTKQQYNPLLRVSLHTCFSKLSLHQSLPIFWKI